MLENILNDITRLPMDRLERNLPDMSTMMRLPWRRPSPSNGALYILQFFSHVSSNGHEPLTAIQQLWASGGRTREPILMKFGKQQQSCWKIF